MRAGSRCSVHRAGAGPGAAREMERKGHGAGKGQGIVIARRVTGLHRLVTPCNGLYRVFRGHICFFCGSVCTRLLYYYGQARGGIWAVLGRTGSEFHPDWFAQMPRCTAVYRPVPVFF